MSIARIAAGWLLTPLLMLIYWLAPKYGKPQGAKRPRRAVKQDSSNVPD